MARERTSALPQERLLAFCILFFASSVVYAAFTPIVRGQIGAAAGESLAYRGIWFVLYLLLMLSIAMRFNMILSVIVRNAMVSVLMVIYLISEFANAGIDGSFVRVALLLLTVMSAAWISRIFSFDDLLTTIARVLTVVIIVHVAVLLTVGTPYVTDELNRSTLLGVSAQSGLFSHKNDAGMVCGAATIMMTFKFLSLRNKQRWVYLFGAIVSAALLLLAGSTGAVVSTAAGLALSVSFLTLKKAASIFACVVAALAVWLILVFDESLLFGVLGRSETLTGRTIIWSWWPEFFSEHPWIGIGYSGFQSPAGPAFRLWDKLPDKYQAVNFHNSFLDVGMQTGIFGLTLMILIVVFGLWRAGIIAFGLRHKDAIVPLSLMSPLVLFATVEFTIPAHNNFATLLFFVMYFKTAELCRIYGHQYSLLKQLQRWNSIQGGKIRKRLGRQIGIEQS
jgi:exopolysaccharide production protein ExoQ